MTQRHLRVKLRYCFFDPACSILSKDQLHRERSCFETNPYPRIRALARSACVCGVNVWFLCTVECVSACVRAWERDHRRKLHVCKRGVQLVTQNEPFIHYFTVELLSVVHQMEIPAQRLFHYYVIFPKTLHTTCARVFQFGLLLPTHVKTFLLINFLYFSIAEAARFFITGFNHRSPGFKLLQWTAHITMLLTNLTQLYILIKIISRPLFVSVTTV